MMCAMSEENERTTPPINERDSAGVLANLPRTRPQRSSARRAAARDNASGGRARHTAGDPAERPKPQAAASRAEARPGAKAGKSTRKRTAGAASAGTGARKAAAGTAGKQARAQSARARAGAAANRAPRQGFESEADSTSGPVTPPGGVELLTAATELLADVAKSGLSRGASALQEIMGRLRP